MINMIKNSSGCRINVGQNGMVWFEGDHEDLVVDSVRLIENEAAREGLTDKVSSMLNGFKKEVKA